MPATFYKHDLLNHFKSILPALESAGAEAGVNAKTFRLRIRLGERQVVLQPQFMTFEHGRKHYTPTFSPQVKRFIGWTPHFNRQWEISTHKLKFKAYALETGLTTPEYSADPKSDLADVIVKKDISSFALDIRGPFKSSRECAIDVEQGEFYERFVRGRNAKIYYWEKRPVCLELERPATVKGDGRSTLKALLEAAAGEEGRLVKLDRHEAYLRYVGKSLDEVPPRDAVQQVDFRYGSGVSRAADMENVDLTKDMPAELEAQLVTIGERLWMGIPADIREQTLYTVDAVLDAGNKLWLTEMNANPFIHPLLYPVMLEAMLKGGGMAAQARPQLEPEGESLTEVLELAMVQFNSGSLGPALQLWDKVLKMRPNHPAALFFSAFALARGSRYVEARPRLDALLSTAAPGNLYIEPARQLLESIDRHPLAGAAVATAPATPYRMAH